LDGDKEEKDKKEKDKKDNAASLLLCLPFLLQTHGGLGRRDAA